MSQSSSNPILAELGFAADERVVVVHADDVGMSEASVAAFTDLVDGGLLSSASLMVPCPWFARAAALCRQRPELDVGVHLTLTSEWEGYRWGPLSTRDPASGLLDEQGCFPRTRQRLQEAARPAAVRRELATQLDRALAAGVDVTHLDSHMFSLFHPDLLPLYVALARERGLPAIITCDGELPMQWFHPDAEARGRELVRGWRAAGLPLMDDQHMFALDDDDDPLAKAKQAFDELQPGLTYMIIHPARDTPELRAMTPQWAHRVREYETFMSPDLRRHVAASGVRVIGCRPLREALRRRLAAATARWPRHQPMRTLRRMDSGLPLGGCDPPFPETVWVNTNAADRVQGFRWLESSRTGLRARCAGSGADFVWPADGLVRYCGISTADFVAFSARRGCADCEVLLQGILNLGLLVLATYEIPRRGGVGYFSREFFARRAAAPAPAASPGPAGTAVFSHLAKPAAVDTAPLLGRWRNSDAAARGLVEITVEDDAGDLAVRALGSGDVGPLDWGPARTGVFACLDEAGKASLSLLATWDFGFLETQLQLRVPTGALASASFNVFKDGSGRPSYVTREFFYRELRAHEE